MSNDTHRMIRSLTIATAVNSFAILVLAVAVVIGRLA